MSKMSQALKDAQDAQNARPLIDAVAISQDGGDIVVTVTLTATVKMPRDLIEAEGDLGVQIVAEGACAAMKDDIDLDLQPAITSELEAFMQATSQPVEHAVQESA